MHPNTGTSQVSPPISSCPTDSGPPSALHYTQSDSLPPAEAAWIPQRAQHSWFILPRRFLVCLVLSREEAGLCIFKVLVQRRMRAV